MTNQAFLLCPTTVVKPLQKNFNIFSVDFAIRGGTSVNFQKS